MLWCVSGGHVRCGTWADDAVLQRTVHGGILLPRGLEHVYGADLRCWQLQRRWCWVVLKLQCWLLRRLRWSDDGDVQWTVCRGFVWRQQWFVDSRVQWAVPCWVRLQCRDEQWHEYGMPHGTVQCGRCRDVQRVSCGYVRQHGGADVVDVQRLLYSRQVRCNVGHDVGELHRSVHCRVRVSGWLHDADGCAVSVGSVLAGWRVVVHELQCGSVRRNTWTVDVSLQWHV